MISRGLAVPDATECARFLAAANYYRFSGYARYFQKAPHLGDDGFRPGCTFEEIRAVYDADEALRTALVRPLARVELMLRSHTARVIADEHGPYGRYLEADFYTDVGDREQTVESCLRDIERSRDRHILRYRGAGGDSADFSELPVWSAAEAWSFGTLSKAIERGAGGTLANSVATRIGVAKAGFAYRVKALVYLRNRCAHHSRLWHHSVIDAEQREEEGEERGRAVRASVCARRHRLPRRHDRPRRCRRPSAPEARGRARPGLGVHAGPGQAAETPRPRT